MAIKDWLFSAPSEEKSSLQRCVEDSVFSQLQLADALEAHNQWITQLDAALKAKDTQKLQVDIIADHTACTLGKWLEGAAKDLCATIPEYKDAYQAHAEFHTIAASIIAQHQHGEEADAKQLFQGEFRSASHRNKVKLGKLFALTKHQST